MYCMPALCFGGARYSNTPVHAKSDYKFPLIEMHQFKTYFNFRANFRLYELFPLSSQSLFEMLKLDWRRF